MLLQLGTPLHRSGGPACRAELLTGDTLLDGATAEERWGSLLAQPLEQAVSLIYPAGKQTGSGSGSPQHISQSLVDDFRF